MACTIGRNKSHSSTPSERADHSLIPPIQDLTQWRDLVRVVTLVFARSVDTPEVSFNLQALVDALAFLQLLCRSPW